MASFPSGVAIVTTVAPDGTPRGLTTTAVSSVSAHPPTILVCVDLGSRTLGALRGRRSFVVNFVGTSGKDKLKGTKKKDGMLGLGGNDKLKGKKGKDGLCGGRGKDKLIGGPGKDKLNGGPGKDREVQ